METQNMNGMLRLDLQMFAGEGEEFGAYDPSTAYEGIETTPATPEPAAAPEGGGEPQPPAEQPPAEPEYLDFGGRKVIATDETRGLHQDFLNQQRYITQLQQFQQQAPVQQQPQTEQPQAPSANMQEWNEETWNKFYENPQEVLGSVIQQTINSVLAEKVDPILEERQWEKSVQEMNEKFHDFGDFTDGIQEVLNANPDLAYREGGLEDAYFRAKAAAASSQPTPEQLMQNPQFIQSVLQNPEIQQQFLTQYLSQKQQTNQQIPNLMGRGSGQSFVPATPEDSPKTLREATRLFNKQLGLR